MKHDSRLRGAARRAAISKLQKIKAKFDARCLTLLPMPSPSATPTLEATATPSVTPVVTSTATPTLTATPTSTPTATPTPTSTPTNTPVPNPYDKYVRCGAAGGYFDSQGHTWESDQPYLSGNSQSGSSSGAILGTVHDELYQSERYGQSFSYGIAVPNGTYDVILHFAELVETQSGQRVFDVSAEGALRVDNLDLISQVGRLTAFMTQFSVTVSDGILNLSFASSIGDAKISGIEIHHRQNGSWGQGTWGTGPSLPEALGEVAAGIVGDTLYMVGDGSTATFAFDISSGAWTDNLEERPFVGDHHGAEVIGDRLYLVGGLGGGSERRIQIYNPQNDTWTSSVIPTTVDWGSPSTSLIGGMLYMAGGVNGQVTHNQAMRFNPQNSTWTSIAPMPLGRNHAPAATDGSKLYIFGGRDGPNQVGPGFNSVQIYDPATNSWQSSTTPGSDIPPLPQARGGGGKAVYLNGEFYVIGGETNVPASATYSRVDVYNPITKAWRLEHPLPTARHGIFPLRFDQQILVAAGGVQAGHSESAIFEIFTHVP